jgi:two-component system phosphate regulon sensor histidine kinase PhoR
MRNTNIRWVIILGAIAILSIIAMQSYWLIQRQSHEEQSFHQTTTIALLKVAEKMATLNKLTLPSGDFIKRMTPNYYIVNYNNEIDADVLEYFLLQEFGSNVNYTDFEYAIYDCTSNRMVYGNHCNLIDPEKGVKSEGNLPKYNEMLPYYFGVKFPSRDENVTASSGLTFTLAMIAVITLAFFAFAILVILNQRRFSEMQRDFINNMTHEFKTPLTSIQLSSDYLSKQPVIQHDDRLNRYTELIRSQYQRLNSQVEKLLNIARLESKEFKLKSEAIDMHQLLDEIVDSKAAESGIEGRVFNRIYQATKYQITADRSHMGNVINNLIDNAVKYSPADKPIDIITKNENSMLTVSILDRGIGIAPIHQKHLFKKFYRVPSGNVHDIKGFGLGLHYVRKILRMLGGDIEVKSALGQGSCFSFHLPIQTE